MAHTVTMPTATLQERANTAINEVIRSLRRLNPQKERIVVALSGGADSVALLYCASRIFSDVLAVHIMHDMRSKAETEADLCIAQQAAEKCQVDFLWKFETIQDRQSGENLEAAARFRRYRGINDLMKIRMKSRFGQNFIPDWSGRCNNSDYQGGGIVATGHHADDQLETLLMKLCRGAGMSGMSGIAEDTKGDGWTPFGRCIRPMLSITRADTEAICLANDLNWTRDFTNSDTAFSRNRIRAEVIPILKELYPTAAQKASGFASICDDARKVILREVGDLFRHTSCQMNQSQSVKADALRLVEDIIIVAWLEDACNDRNIGKSSMKWDSVNSRMLEDVVGAIRGRKVKKFLWPAERVIEVGIEEVRVRRQTAEERESQLPAKE